MNVIYRLDGEYAAAEVSIPVSAVLECSDAAEEFAAEWTVCGLRVHWDGEGSARKLCFDVDLQGAVRLFGKQNRRVFAAADYRPDASSHGCTCVVCYPDPDDSIWSVCKRYRVGRSRVMEINRLANVGECDCPASLSGVPYLLI